MNEQTRICLENADLALRPPELITPVPREYYPEIDDYTMSSGIARTPGGRFYLSWFGRDDGPDTVMLLARSDDEGKSWSEPEYLIDPGFTPDGHHLSALVGTVWCDPAGRLWWFFSVSIGYYDGRAGVWAAVCGNPDDEHPAWGKPFRLWHGCALNKPTVLSTGEWGAAGLALAARTNLGGPPLSVERRRSVALCGARPAARRESAGFHRQRQELGAPRQTAVGRSVLR